MANGINAIKGFDYQATVILNRLFDHFDRNGPTARARPEGVDDLDLSWTKDAVEHRRYEQIKKPRGDDQGNLKPIPWTLSDVVDELLPIPSRTCITTTMSRFGLSVTKSTMPSG